MKRLTFIAGTLISVFKMCIRDRDIAENDEAARFIMAADYLSNVMIYSDEYKSSAAIINRAASSFSAIYARAVSSPNTARCV